MKSFYRSEPVDWLRAPAGGSPPPVVIIPLAT